MKKSSKLLLIVLGIVLAIALPFLIRIIYLQGWQDVPELVLDPEQSASDLQLSTGELQQTTQPDYEWIPEQQTQETIQLENNLAVESMANYAGLYMEDGTDEPVSNVMMIIVRNNGEQDLQLARIHVNYGDFTAQFEVSNLPAGEAAVLLEQNRAAMPEAVHQSVAVKNVVFFPEPMTVPTDKIEVTGGNGYLDVKNISGEDIAGTLRLFYKNSASDLLYGGITYAATVKEGIAAGETVRVLAGHYAEGSSRIVNVTIGE